MPDLPLPPLTAAANYAQMERICEVRPSPRDQKRESEARRASKGQYGLTAASSDDCARVSFAPGWDLMGY